MEFINKLAQLFPIERIYLKNDFSASPEQRKELTIVLPRSSKIHATEARPLIGMVMADHPEYTFSIFTVPDIKRALQYGSVVFFAICQEENLLYQSEGSADLLSPDITANAVLKKAKRNFEKEWKKITGFGDGFQFYMDQGNLTLAAFMLHQVVELSYRTVELLVIGKDKTTHSILNHQKLLKGYSAELASLFDEQDEAEMALLTLLDEAYRSVRYELDYEIDQEQLQQLSAKADLLKTLVLAQYEKMLASFTKEVEKEEEPGVEQKVAIDQIISEICRLVPVLRIYKLARHAKVDHRSGMCAASEEDPVEVHYYLLVICDTPCCPDVFNVQGLINQDKNINATVTLLMHSLKDLQDALHDHQVFFHEILREGEMIYGADSFDLPVPELDTSKMMLANAQLWYNRYNRAKALMEAAANVTEEENGIVMANMLSQAMLQLCLIYIEHSIEYRPNQLSLKHLFALCRMIDPLIDEVFPVSRQEDGKLFEVLLDADRNLRYKMLACVDTTDQCVLLRRCNEWMEKVGQLREEE
ncbi:HEPN domain-containing protein [Pedobacter sp. GR22-6]|uniref:HEPN domain-containing protein n=1 Tax=Pedobacter sp. GR22-6 TaxID=3127957 RepID=UPI00307F2BBA